MLINSLVAYAHFLAVFGIAATVVFEWLTFSRTPTLAEARRLALIDRWYGISAAVLLLAGFARAYHFEKGMAFYAANPFFQAKLGLFLVMGLLSIIPTVQFIRWGPALKAGRAPSVSDAQYRRTLLSLRLQMVLLAAVALCASLMAHGMGA